MDDFKKDQERFFQRIAEEERIRANLEHRDSLVSRAEGLRKLTEVRRMLDGGKGLGEVDAFLTQTGAQRLVDTLIETGMPKDEALRTVHETLGTQHTKEKE